MTGAPADLRDAERLIAERGGALGHPLHLLEATESTNDDAKDGAKRGAPHGSTWVADTQTKGRGRQGRAWQSPRGENLLFSVLWRQACPLARLPLLSIAAGLAVCEVARRVTGRVDVGLKWPNDVVRRVGGPDGALRLEKLAGILVETSMSGRTVDGVVVGVGMNVHTRVFPDELAGRATSLSLLASRPVERASVLADLLAAIDRDHARRRPGPRARPRQARRLGRARRSEGPKRPRRGNGGGGRRRRASRRRRSRRAKDGLERGGSAPRERHAAVGRVTRSA
jgi:BirA family biotin operon repressor/biotin-[acetyl-CoA-carboxylase] ligase